MFSFFLFYTKWLHAQQRQVFHIFKKQEERIFEKLLNDLSIIWEENELTNVALHYQWVTLGHPEVQFNNSSLKILKLWQTLCIFRVQSRQG